MTDRTTLLALAERCEQAAGPDRKLDGAVWCAAVGYSFVKWDGAGVVWRGADGSIHHCPADRVPRYTASLDAAVRLVPEGCGYDFGKNLLGYAWGGITMPDHNEVETSAATPALSLCAAALRARAAAYE